MTLGKACVELGAAQKLAGAGGDTKALRRKAHLLRSSTLGGQGASRG